MRGVLVLILVALISHGYAALPQSELNAMNQFRAAVVPDLGKDELPCLWNGVVCNTTMDGVDHVVELFIHEVWYTGSIGSWIQSLTELKSMRLMNFNFTSPISSLSTLTQLSSIAFGKVNNLILPAFPSSLGSLWIEDTDLTTLPSLSGTNLISLVVRNSPINGPIPQSYAALAGLKVLEFSSLTNLNGQIPNFGNGFISFEISDTKVSGQMPDITVFESLRLANNELSGTIPGAIFTSSVKSISITESQLTGTIPSQISQSVALESFTISRTQLNGSIPVEVTALPELLSLDLSSNQFSGAIPTFANSPVLNTLNLANNQFSGSVPVILGPNLRRVDLRNNILTGSIPAGVITSASKLTSVKLSYNSLGGTIPALGSQISELELDSNSFSGSLPDFTGTNIATFSINNNQITGSIPALGKLVVFSASSNQLTGFLPSSIPKTLFMFAVGNNGLYGDVPLSFYDADIRYLDLSGNKLSGCFNATLPQLTGCILPQNFLCCVPYESKCDVADLDCPNCPTPGPTSTAFCQRDSARKAVWVVLGDLVVTEDVTLYNTIVDGNLQVLSDVAVTDGVIDVKGCVSIDGSLTLILTDEEISQLLNSFTLERELIRYNSSCDSSANLYFGDLIVQGDVPCTNTTAVQQNSPGSIKIIVTSQKIKCPGELEDWMIAVIVVGCLAIAGAAVGIGMGVKTKRAKKHSQRLRHRLSSSSSTQPLTNN